MIGLAMMTAMVLVKANELNTLCMSKDASDQLFCGAYIVGATDGIYTGEMTADLNGDNGKLCIPAGVTRQQVVDLVKTFLRDSKLDHDVQASVFVFGALYQKWPCAAADVTSNK